MKVVESIYVLGKLIVLTQLVQVTAIRRSALNSLDSFTYSLLSNKKLFTPATKEADVLNFYACFQTPPKE